MRAVAVAAAGLLLAACATPPSTPSTPPPIYIDDAGYPVIFVPPAPDGGATSGVLPLAPTPSGYTYSPDGCNTCTPIGDGGLYACTAASCSPSDVTPPDLAHLHACDGGNGPCLNLYAQPGQ